MRLVEARIEGFGQYRDRNISFAAGLNVIHGVNESGKTTLMKFIEGVLYGFYKPSKRRQYTEDYEKYRPWDGGTYAGTLIYENRGRTIAIYRNFNEGADEVRMFDCETGEDLTSQLTYNGVIRQVDPSSRDWKISPAAFRNTISIVQGKAQPDLEALGGELQESLMNLTTSGDEDISVRNSLQSLRKQLAEIGGERQEKSSRLGQLDAKEQELRSKLTAAKEQDRKQERILNELSELPEEVEDPEEAAYLIEKVGRPDQLEHLRALSEEKEKLAVQNQSLRRGKRGDEKQYETLIGLQKDAENARERLAEAQAAQQMRQEELQKTQADPSEEQERREEQRRSDPLTLIVLTAGGIAILASVILAALISPGFLAGFAAGAGLCGYAGFRFHKQRQKAEQRERARQEQEEKRRLAEGTARAMLLEASVLAQKRRTELDAASERLQQLLQSSGVASVEEYGGFVRSQAKAETIRARLRQIEEERSRWIRMYASSILRERREYLKEKLKELQAQEEDPSAIREQLAQVTQTKDRLLMERDSLQAAYAAIESLSKEVQREFAPILSENIKKTVENITSGRYNTIYVSDSGGVRAGTSGGKQLSVDQLSAGTGDQIYFAVRLGMIDLLSPQVKLPLILDDAFARYDDERLRRILELLIQEAGNRQILIFSCQTREKEMLLKMKAVFSCSEL